VHDRRTATDSPNGQSKVIDRTKKGKATELDKKATESIGQMLNEMKEALSLSPGNV
jgi:hypothetical protein